MITHDFSDMYVTCIHCLKPVPEISKQTEAAYRFHPACRPEAVAKREADKAERHRLDEKVAGDMVKITRMARNARRHRDANKEVE